MKSLSSLPVLPLIVASSVCAAQPSSELATAAVARSASISRPVLRTVAVATTAATAEPARGGFLDAAQIFAYSEGSLYHGYAAPGRITDIMLQPGEQLGAVAAGDTVRWVIGDTLSGQGDARRAHVLVKPSAPGLSTSLVITTDRRSYHLVFTSTPAVALTAISWTYPQDGLLAVQHSAASPAIVPTSGVPAFDPARLTFDYAITGDTPSWRPLRVFDDGRQTFIEFPASLATGEAPPLFVMGPGGAPDLVNYRQRGRYYVVDRLFDAAELRLGIKPQLVVRIARTAPVGRTAS